MNRQAITAGALAFVVVIVAVCAINRLADGGGDGFIGLGPRIADVNVVFEVLLVLGLTFGMRLARAGHIEAHRRNQTIWVLANAALVVAVMTARRGGLACERRAGSHGKAVGAGNRESRGEADNGRFV